MVTSGCCLAGEWVVWRVGYPKLLLQSAHTSSLSPLDLSGYAAYHQQALVFSFPCVCQGLHVPDEAAKSASARCACRHYECYADEHYVPTLLAYKGLEEHTDCLGYTTSVDW